MRTGDTLDMPVLAWKVWTRNTEFTSLDTDWADVPNDVQALVYWHGGEFRTLAYGVGHEDVYSMPGYGPEHDKPGLMLLDAEWETFTQTVIPTLVSWRP